MSSGLSTSRERIPSVAHHPPLIVGDRKLVYQMFDSSSFFFFEFSEIALEALLKERLNQRILINLGSHIICMTVLTVFIGPCFFSLRPVYVKLSSEEFCEFPSSMRHYQSVHKICKNSKTVS